MNPSIEYAQIAPALIVFGAAIIGVLVEAFAPAASRTVVHGVLSGSAVVAAFVAVVALATDDAPPRAVILGSVAADGLSLALQGLLLTAALPALALMVARGNPLTHTEAVPLAMFALGGMLAFVSAEDWLTLFVALEVFSLPLYLMCALARRRDLLPLEAALKYFLLGAFSSAILLFGVALRFAATGSTDIAAAPQDEVLGAAGAALIGVGLLFKVGAVPFHSWVPDVYQGAPTPVTAFMASATKIAAFGVLVRITMVAFDDVPWRPVAAVVAVATLAVGSIAAVTQSDVKRMLAYSAIAHTGFLLVGVYAGTVRGMGAVCFYLAVYALSTVGAFAVAGAVREVQPDGRTVEVSELDRWAGLGRRRPALAGAMALFLLAFAGIPLTSGFVGKFAVFAAAAERGGVWLVVVGVLASAVAAVFYLRVIVTMYFAPDHEYTPEVPAADTLTWFAIGVGAVSVVMLGVYPQPLLDLFGDLSLLGR
ncbi:NADH-quinone oxidoreductase subunit NuoN [Tsukamurella strandjordii]|uniref:NADH-quinone oxidoreductase subunit N n=1 Tax=Tsukamurella strandjordii TaxID=147577 RepID=A0AA90NKD5_9ACTN|nr:NADH-quinone oxidoreductase subunit NuoN [Tsukamurella strandjordii]MDP0400470.1 NADH-quinone oxidoreductase subunit NuoN [Tsukamurella strandjordii]